MEHYFILNNCHCIAHCCFYTCRRRCCCRCFCRHRPFLPGASPREPAVIPTTQASSFRLQYFPYVCDVPSVAVFCGEYTESFPGVASRFVFKLFVTIPVAPVTTGIIIHFVFHSRCISITKCLYFNVSASFSWHFYPLVLPHLSVFTFSLICFNYYIWPICHNFSICVRLLIPSHCHIFLFTYWLCVCLSVCPNFLSFRRLVFCVLHNINVHQHYHVSLRTRAIPKHSILIKLLSSLFISFTQVVFTSTSSYKIVIFKVICTDRFVFSCHYCTFRFSLDVTKFYPSICLFIRHQFLVAFAKLRKNTVSFVLSVCPHGTTRFPMDGFWLKLILDFFSKICRENSSFIKILQE